MSAEQPAPLGPVDEAMRQKIAASLYNTFTMMPGVTYGELVVLSETSEKASYNVQDIVNGS